MLTFLPFILLVASLGAILFVVVRKYPQLTLLDVENISEAKEGRKKNEFIKKRAKKKAETSKDQMQRAVKPVAEKIKEGRKQFRQYVSKVKQTVAEESRRRQGLPVEDSKPSKKKIVVEPAAEDKIKKLLQDAEHFFENHEYDKAEKAYIHVIRLDQKNKRAYLGLGDVYVAQDQLLEAEQTYQFLAHLDKHSEAVHVRLADLAEKKGDTDMAIVHLQRAVDENDGRASLFARLADLLEQTNAHEAAAEAIEQALKLEPENPKYIDKLIEVSIMVGDKTRAEEALLVLKRVNPENKKLALFEQRIRHLSSVG